MRCVTLVNPSIRTCQLMASLDESKPTCKRCVKAGYLCRGYERKLEVRYYHHGELPQFESVPQMAISRGSSPFSRCHDCAEVSVGHSSHCRSHGRLRTQSCCDPEVPCLPRIGSYAADRPSRLILIGRMPGNPRFDPLNCYPLRLQAGEHILVDHFMKVGLLECDVLYQTILMSFR